MHLGAGTILPFCPVPFNNAEFPAAPLPVLRTVDDILNLSKDELKTYLEGYGKGAIDLTGSGLAEGRRALATAIGVNEMLLGQVTGVMTRAMGRR